MVKVWLDSTGEICAGPTAPFFPSLSSICCCRVVWLDTGAPLSRVTSLRWQKTNSTKKK